MWAGIADDLRGKINTGGYAPGETLPSEDALAATYGAHRTTVRKALEKLTQEGLLDRGQGRRGRRVRRHKPILFHGMLSESPDRLEQRKAVGMDAWRADVADQGRDGGQSITVAIEEAGPEIAHRLGLDVGDAVVVRRRIRTVDSDPHNSAETHYPHGIVKGTAIEHPADIKQGTIALLRDMGYPQLRFRDELTTRMPTPEEAAELLIPPGVPVLVQYRTGYSNGDLPIKVTVTIWPGDRAGLVYEEQA
jgi:GntR family transcriptional regulator